MCVVKKRCFNSMAINPYTLNGLYEKGIIDYVPFELLTPTPVGVQTMTNPYLNLAKQGSLYSQYGSGDSYSFSAGNTGALDNTNIGSQSAAGTNAYGLAGIGFQSNTGINAYGLQGIGSQSNAGFNAYGVQGIGSQSNAGMNAYGTQGIGSHSASANGNAWGGITDAKNSISNGFNAAASVYERTPGFIKGAVSLLIIGGTAYHLLKRGKKSAGSALSKLNP